MVAGEDTLVVIEDDHHISDLVAMYLRRDGFRVLQADDGEAGLALVERERPKLVIVDIGLPGDLDGFDVCRRLRSGSPSARRRTESGRSVTPVLILSARDDEVDRVLGLELGADDYVTKPFSARELVARVHAILRRTGAGRLPSGPRGGGARTASRSTPAAARSPARHRGPAGHPRVRPAGLPRRQPRAWPCPGASSSTASGATDWYGDERTVDVHVRQLRKKLGDDLPLATVWGVGYRLG